MVGLFVVFLSLVFFSPPNSMRLTICGKRSPFTLGLGSRNEENNGYSESTFRKNEGKKKKKQIKNNEKLQEGKRIELQVTYGNCLVVAVL